MNQAKACLGHRIIASPTQHTPEAPITNWAYPERAYAEDEETAYCSINGAYETYYGYGISISSLLEILQVEVGTKIYLNADTQRYQLQVSWDDGETWSDWSYEHYNASPLQMTWHNVTSLTSWTADKLSKIRVKIQYLGTAGGGGEWTVYLDWIPVCVVVKTGMGRAKADFSARRAKANFSRGQAKAILLNGIFDPDIFDEDIFLALSGSKSGKAKASFTSGRAKGYLS